MPRFLSYSETPLAIDGDERRYPRSHVFEDLDVDAINTSLAVDRPLLLRGEPGVGKSQLALAVAVMTGRPFIKEVVDARMESRDLLWRFDAVRRLADAQKLSEARQRERLEWFKAHGVENGDPFDEGFYIQPGALWFAFDWEGAIEQAKRAGGSVPKLRSGSDPSTGVVVLLDEIDKADSSLPNGLLGVLGDGEFRVPGLEGEVRRKGGSPLVVITTNEERSLPDAFLRRCVVYEMKFPEEDLPQWLEIRGRAHLGPCELPQEAYDLAAEKLIEDRERYGGRGLMPPGLAEYLDLLRAFAELREEGVEVEVILEQARRFVLQKHSTGR